MEKTQDKLTMSDRYRLETPAFCSKCGKSYYRKDALVRHMKECGRIPPLICCLCPYRTFRKDNLMRHSMKHMKNVVMAEQDQDSAHAVPFTPQELLEGPTSSPPPSKQQYLQDNSRKEEEPETILQEEESSLLHTHGDPCGDQDKLTDRRRLDSPVGCDFCGKVYHWKGALRRHMKECGREPPMVCNFCSYRTFRKDNLLSHQFRKHNVLQN